MAMKKNVDWDNLNKSTREEVDWDNLNKSTIIADENQGYGTAARSGFMGALGNAIGTVDKVLENLGKPSYLSDEEWHAKNANTWGGQLHTSVQDYGSSIEDNNRIAFQPMSGKSIVQGVSGMVPYAAALAPLGATAMRSGNANAMRAVGQSAAARMGMGVKGIEFAGEAAPALGMGFIGSFPEAMTEGQSAYDEAIANGMSEQEAQDVRNKVTAWNVMLLTGSNAAELVTNFGKIQNLLPKGTKEKIAAKLGGTFFTEGAQEGAQETFPALAMGKDIDWDAVEQASVIGGFGGATMSAFGIGANALLERKSKKQTANTEQDKIQKSEDSKAEIAENPQINTSDDRMERVFNAVAGQESGGDYNAVNKDTGAIGKYQIMPENWGPWAEEAGLPADAPKTPENQEKIARNKFSQYVQKYGVRDAIQVWYAGEGSLEWSEEALNRPQGENGEYPSVNEYVNSTMARIGDIEDVKQSTADMTEDEADAFFDNLDKEEDVISDDTILDEEVENNEADMPTADELSELDRQEVQDDTALKDDVQPTFQQVAENTPEVAENKPAEQVKDEQWLNHAYASAVKEAQGSSVTQEQIDNGLNNKATNDLFQRALHGDTNAQNYFGRMAAPYRLAFLQRETQGNVAPQATISNASAPSASENQQQVQTVAPAQKVAQTQAESKPRSTIQTMVDKVRSKAADKKEATESKPVTILGKATMKGGKELTKVANALININNRKVTPSYDASKYVKEHKAVKDRAKNINYVDGNGNAVDFVEKTDTEWERYENNVSSQVKETIDGLNAIEDVTERKKELWQYVNGFKEELQNVLKPALDELQEGMGNGVSLLPAPSELEREDGKMVRATNNAPWYSKWYKEHGKAPSQWDLFNIAYKMMTGQGGEYSQNFPSSSTAPEIQPYFDDNREKIYPLLEYYYAAKEAHAKAVKAEKEQANEIDNNQNSKLEQVETTKVAEQSQKGEEVTAKKPNFAKRAFKVVMKALEKSGLTVVTDKAEMERVLGESLSDTQKDLEIQKLIINYEEGNRPPDLTPVMKAVNGGKEMYTVAFYGDKPKNYVPKKVGRAYKLMELYPDGSLHALFAGTERSYKLGEWNWASGYIADENNEAGTKGVKAMKLAPRFGWHMGTGLPATHHLMGVGDVLNPSMQYPTKTGIGHPKGAKRVWVEVFYDATNDYTDLALANPSKSEKDIRGLIPFGGYYMFQESNLSNWVIASSIKFNRIIPETDRQKLLKAGGYDEELVWRTQVLRKKLKGETTRITNLLNKDDLAEAKRKELEERLANIEKVRDENEQKVKEISNGKDFAYKKRTTEELMAERDRIRSEVFDNPDMATQYLQTADGEVYGFVKDNKVYIDESKMDPSVPVHEYTHVWDNVVKQVNPELWKRGVELLKQTSMWEQVKNNPLYANISQNEDLLASEVHAMLAGEDSKAILADLEKNNPKSLVSAIKQWIKDFWKEFKDTMTAWGSDEASKISLDEFTKLPLMDMAKGVNLQEQLAKVNKKTTSEENTANGKEQTQEVKSIDDLLKSKEGYYIVTNGKDVELALSEYITRGNIKDDSQKIKIKNKATGIEAYISASSLKKMRSDKATSKSIENGFSAHEHLTAAANIPTLFKNAKLDEIHGDNKVKDGENTNIKSMKRFVSDYSINGEPYRVKITVKESIQNGHRIYSVELLEIEKTARNLKQPIIENRSISRAVSDTEIVSQETAKGNTKAESVTEIPKVEDLLKSSQISIYNNLLEETRAFLQEVFEATYKASSKGDSFHNINAKDFWDKQKVIFKDIINQILNTIEFAKYDGVEQLYTIEDFLHEFTSHLDNIINQNISTRNLLTSKEVFTLRSKIDNIYKAEYEHQKELKSVSLPSTDEVDNQNSELKQVKEQKTEEYSEADIDRGNDYNGFTKGLNDEEYKQISAKLKQKRNWEYTVDEPIGRYQVYTHHYTYGDNISTARFIESAVKNPYNRVMVNNGNYYINIRDGGDCLIPKLAYDYFIYLKGENASKTRKVSADIFKNNPEALFSKNAVKTATNNPAVSTIVNKMKKASEQPGGKIIPKKKANPNGAFANVDKQEAEKNFLAAMGIKKAEPKKFMNIVDDSDAALDAAIKEAMSELNKLSANPVFNPDLHKALFKVGAIYLQRGVNKFADWAKQMEATLGEKAKPWLGSVWKSIEAYPKDEKVDDAKMTNVVAYVGQLYDEGYNTKAELMAEVEKSVGTENMETVRGVVESAFAGIDELYNPTLTIEEPTQEVVQSNQESKLAKEAKELNATFTDRDELNGIEIRFSGPPSDEFKDVMKKAGFKWSYKQKMWWAKRSDKAMSFAKEIGYTSKEENDNGDSNIGRLDGTPGSTGGESELRGAERGRIGQNGDISTRDGRGQELNGGLEKVAPQNVQTTSQHGSAEGESVRATVQGERGQSEVSENGLSATGRQRASSGEPVSVERGSGQLLRGTGNAGRELSGSDSSESNLVTPKVTSLVNGNFHIDDPSALLGGSQKVRFSRNVAAIEKAQELIAEGRKPTEEEKMTMATFTGWGSFAQEVFGGDYNNLRPKAGWEEEAQWLHDNMSKEEWESARDSVQTAFYTDPFTVSTMWDMVRKLGFKAGKVLEPSMGIGNFFGLMPKDMMERSQLAGIELESLSGKMAQMLYPNANIQIKGYQESKTADDFYDIIIGNVPFANFSPSDRRYNKFNAQLHDYFFLKGLDQVRPGGLMVALTSSKTLDKVGKPVRIELARKANLVAAYRLPTGAFKDYAGTQVVADILIFQKKAEPSIEGISKLPWVTSNSYNGDDKVNLNNYFVENPQNVLGRLEVKSGRFGNELGVRRNEDFEERMNEIVSELPADIYKEREKADVVHYVSNNTDDLQNSIVEKNGKLYAVFGEYLKPLEAVKKYPVKVEAKVAEFESKLKALYEMRKTLGNLMDADRNNDSNAEDYRKQLNKEYDNYVSKYGKFLKINNKGKEEISDNALRYMNQIDDPYANALASLENKGKKATIFERSTVRTETRIENPTVAQAFVMARNESVNLDVDRIAELSHTPRADVEKMIIDGNLTFKTPSGNYEVNDVYLSGNVREKLREAEAALADGDESMKRNVEELKKVIPPTVPYYNIEANLGAPWINREDYKNFIAELVGISPDNLTNRDITLMQSGAGWTVELSPRIQRTPNAQNIYSTEKVNFTDVLKHAFNHTKPSITIRDKEGNVMKQATDEAISKAIEKIEAVYDKFGQWIWADNERKLRLENDYNEGMNSIATPKYDGSFMEMPGMALQRGDSPFSLRQHQINAIYRGIVNGSGIYAHEVGTGKTYTMAGVALESRRLGIAKKPLLLAFNANSKSVAKDIKQMYPNAKVLYIDNLDKNSIARKLNQVKTDDWDVIVLPHSQIDKLALKEETLNELVQEQIVALEEAAIEAAKEDNIELSVEDMDKMLNAQKGEKGIYLRSQTVKNLVNQRNRIKENIKKMADKTTSDQAIPFEELGIDMVIVDEAHAFKKPPFDTKLDMKGLQTNASADSIKLNFLTKYIQSIRNGKGVHLFTGTPITNTLTELFHMMRYVMPREMANVGVDNFDSWFNVFAQEVSDVEITGTGEYKSVARLAAFTNVSELRRMAGQYLDIVFADDMPEFKPRKTAGGKVLSDADLTDAEREELVNGRTEEPQGRPYKKIINEVIPMGKQQEVILKTLVERAKEIKKLSGKARREFLKFNPQYNPVVIETDANKAGMDARLFDITLSADKDSKIERATSNIVKIHNDSPKAVQVVFLDKGMSDTKEVTVGRDEADKPIKQKQPAFNVAKELIKRLVEEGIPREEIILMESRYNPEQRAEIAEKLNKCEYRVVIGSTQTLGVGVNMQENLRAMHHLDAPWMPGDLEQRNGRGHRQGNKWNTVLEYRYITEKIDGKRWQVLTVKDKFIKMFLKAEDGVRTIEGDAVDMSSEEGSTNDFAETLSKAAGDPRILIKNKLDADVKKLEKKERTFLQGIRDSKFKIENLKDKVIPSLKERIEHYKTDSEQYEAEKAKDFEIELVGGFDAQNKPSRKFTDRKEANEHMATIFRQIMGVGTKRKLGKYAGFDLEVAKELVGSGTNFIVYINGAETYEAKGQMSSISAILNNIKGRIKSSEDELKQSKETISVLESAIEQDFPSADTLASKKKMLKDIEQDLQDNPVPPPDWLVQGAPIDADVFVNGERFSVTGHKATTEGGYYVVGKPYDSEDTKVIPYQKAQDVQGMNLFDSNEHGISPEYVPPQKNNAQKDTKHSVSKADKVIQRSFAEVKAEAQKAFPGATITETANGFKATLPNGDVIAVNITDNIITNESEKNKALQEHGYNADDNVVYEGNWRRVSGQDIVGVLTLGTKQRIGTAYHEVMHFARNILNAKENKALDIWAQSEKRKGSKKDIEEIIADGYRDWRIQREQGMGSAVGKIFQKMQDFWYKMLSVLTGEQNQHNVMRMVESGEIFSRLGDGEIGLYNAKKESLVPVHTTNRGIKTGAKLSTIRVAHLLEGVKDDGGNGADYVDENGGLVFDQNLPRSSVAKVDNDTAIVTRQQLHATAKSILPIYIGKKIRNASGLYSDHAKAGIISSQGRISQLSSVIGMHIVNDKGIKAEDFASELLEGAREKFGADIDKLENMPRYAQLKEGIADFARLYMADKRQAQNAYPAFFKAFEKAIDADQALRVKVDKFSNEIKSWAEQTPEARARAGITRKTQRKPFRNWEDTKEWAQEKFHNFYTNWIDDKDPLNRAVREIESVLGNKISAEDDPYVIARMAQSNAASRINLVIEGAEKGTKQRAIWHKALNRVFNGAWKNDVCFKDIADLTAQLNKRAKTDTVAATYLKENGFIDAMDALGTYLLANRYLEVWETKESYNASMTYEDAETVARNAPGEIKQAAELYYQYDENLLNVMKNAGMLSEKAYEGLSKYSRYCPLFRDMADEADFEKYVNHLGKMNSYINISNGIRALTETGSDRTVVDDPVQAMVKMTTAIISKGEKNKVAQKFVELSTNSGIGRFVIPVYNDRGEIDNKSNPQENTFTVWRNGVKQSFRTTADMYEILEGNSNAANAFTEGLDFICANKMASTLRRGATISPSFMLANVQKDTLEASFNSENGFKPIIDTLRGTYALAFDPEFRARYNASGANMASMFRQDEVGIKDRLDELEGRHWTQKPGFNIARKLFLWWEHMGELLENGTRAGEFKLALENGKSDIEAALAAKNVTIDFSRGGKVGRAVNKYVPFFNAVIQGGDIAIRTIANHPTKALTAGVMMAMATAMLWAINQDEPWYEELTAEEKMSAWHFGLGNGTHFSIPKPNLYGQAFAGSVEAMLETAYAKDPKMVKTWAKHFVLDNIPSILPTIAKPLLEVHTNRDFYWQSDIVSRRYQNLPPAEQMYNSTSGLARGIGRTLDVSPIKVDHLIRGYTGTAGTWAVRRLDLLNSEKVAGPATNLAEDIGMDRFVKRDFAHSRSIDEWYELKNTLAANHAAYDKKGIIPTYITGANKISKAISDTNKAIQIIKASTKYTPEQKRAMIDKAEQKNIKLAKLGLKQYSKYAEDDFVEKLKQRRK